MIIEDIDLYIANLVERINKLKTAKKTSLYDIDVEFSTQEKRNEAVPKIREYFNRFEYGIEIKLCNQCGGRKCDIIILWSL